MSNRYICDVIQDLLALYHDGICSEDSRAVVEQHLGECEKCSAIAKQLDSSEIEDEISAQAKGVLKKHGRKQRRKIIIIVACALAVILAITFFWVIKPRVEINNFINSVLPDVGAGAEYFTEYDVTGKNLVVKQQYGYSIGIPADYVERDVNLDVHVYSDTDNTDLAIMLMPSEDLSDMNLYIRDNFENLDDAEYDIMIATLEKWFDKLGNGQPDSAYGFFKNAYMLDNNDRSFWDIDQNIAFVVMGTMKLGVARAADEIYIYETDEKCGIITIMNPNENRANYFIIADMFAADDLNSAYALIIKTQTLEQAYAVINSVTFK